MDHSTLQPIPTVRDMFCVCGHSISRHAMLSGTECLFDGCACGHWGLDDMSGRATEKTRDSDIKAQLIAMFDAAIATAATVVINSTRPGLVESAAALLPVWSSARNLTIEEHVYPSTTPHIVSWVNLHVRFGPSALDGAITIIQSRNATEADIARHNASLNTRPA